MEFLEEILPNILNTWLLPLITTIITTIVTYHTTKNITKNSRKLEIKQKSFDNVYLPLYRILKKYSDLNLSHEESVRLYYKLFVITERNYIYTNPILVKLLRELKKLLNEKKFSEEKFIKIYQHISDEYYKLRKYLDYPTINFIQSFGSLNLKYKILTLLYLPICSTFLSFYMYSMTDKSTVLQTFSIYWIVISIFLLLLITIASLLFILINFIIRKFKIKLHTKNPKNYIKINFL
jgi:hypothetical protein